MPAKSVSAKKFKAVSPKTLAESDTVRVSPPYRIKKYSPGQTRFGSDQVDIGPLELSGLIIREHPLETYKEEIPSQIITFRWPTFQVERFDEFASKCDMNRGELIRTLLEAQMFKADLSLSELTSVEDGAES